MVNFPKSSFGALPLSTPRNLEFSQNSRAARNIEFIREFGVQVDINTGRIVGGQYDGYIYVDLREQDTNRFSARGENESYFIVGTDGDDIIRGSDADDVIIGLDGNDRISGGGGDDLILGGDGDDTLIGNSGADIIFGGNGNDALFARRSTDDGRGWAENDFLFGGAGNDTLTSFDPIRTINRRGQSVTV